MPLLISALSVFTSAIAGNVASAPPPPAVDFSALAPSASERKIQVDGKPHPVLAQLLTEHTAVAAGTRARVGLHLVQDPEWHTYWKSPGDIGQPTDIVWTTPAQVTVDPHIYPVPQRFEQTDEISYGYDGEVLLISEIDVPADTPLGDHTLGAKANWLVCKSVCIQGEADLEVPLKVVAEAAEVAPAPWAPLFPHYAAQHPTDALSAPLGVDYGLSAATIPADGTFRAAFLLTPTDGAFAPVSEDTWPTFTPIVPFDWSWGMSRPPAVRHLDDGRVLIVIDGEAYEPEPIPADAKVAGLVQLQIGDRWFRTEISGSLPLGPPGSDAVASGSPVIALADAQVPRDAPEAPPEAPPEASPPPEEPDAAAIAPLVAGPTPSLVLSVLLGLLGGLILNVMPCVLPVLTLKLYGLVEQTEITPRDRRVAGLAYTGGILASFLALAAMVIVSQTVLDISVGWGFQFQYPGYVAALATVVFVFGLSLFGVFEVPAFGSNAAADAASREGPVGYFLYGVFAVLLATPCSAPFLGPAIAYAFTSPPLPLTLVFAAIGLGLASPFLVIAFVPGLFRLLPRPGPWMESFKQLMGFTLIATTVWLVDVLSAQVGADGTIGFLAFLLATALGCWIFGHYGGLAASRKSQGISALVGLGIVAGGAWMFLDLEVRDDTCDDGSLSTDLSFADEIPWQAFSEERVAALEGTPVFIDFTADWCVSCKVNEKTILESRSVRDAMAKYGVVPLKADFTRRDAVIADWLRRYRRAGVPMYLVLYPDPAKEPILLPEVITPDMVIQALQAVGA